MTEQTKSNLRRWILSSAVTFLAGFSIVLLAQWEDITLASFQTGSIVGIIFLAVRAGFKALLEGFLLWWNNRKKE